MDILTLEKQVQLNVMNKACGILQQKIEPKSPKKKGKKAVEIEVKIDAETVYTEQ
jgi:hypothetical protein